MRIRQARQLYSSIRHTRLTQLWHRARLMFLRRAGWTRRGALGSPPPLSVATPPPQLTSAPHAPMVEREQGGATLQLLSQRVPLQLPLDWTIPTVVVGRPLAELEIHYLDWFADLDDQEFCDFSRDWMTQNSAPAGGRPWRTSWNAYGLSIRCMNWLRGLTERGAGVPAKPRAAIADEVARQLSFLERNLELDLGGNHLLKDLTAMLTGGAFFNGAAAERWTQRAMRLLARELPEQLLADGMHYERSPSYHALVFLDLLQCHCAMPASPLKDQLWRRLHDAARPLVDLTHPDGGPSLFNDGGMTKAPAARAVTALFIEAGGAVPATRPVFAFEDAGYFGMRGDGELLIVDCGPIGPDHLPAHGHGDVLAFEWSVGGRRIFVDFGVYEYTAGEWRARSRATRSHNTVTVDGADQAEFWSAFRVGRRPKILERSYRRGDAGFELTGSHDGFSHLAGRPVHRRRIDAAPGRVELRDEVLGGAGQVVESRLLLHPDCEVTRGADGFCVRSGPVRVDAVTDAEVRIEDAWWCPDIGVKIRTKQLVLTLGRAPVASRITLRAQP